MVFSNQRRSLIVLLSSNLFWQSLVCLLTWKSHWLKFKIRVWIPMSTIQMTPVYQVWPLMTTQLDSINQPMKSMNKEMSIVSFLVTVLQQTDSRHDCWQPSIKNMSQNQTQSLSPCLYPRPIHLLKLNILNPFWTSIHISKECESKNLFQTLF